MRSPAEIKNHIASLNRPVMPLADIARGGAPALAEWRRQLDDWKAQHPGGEDLYANLLAELDETERALDAQRRVDAEVAKLNLPGRVGEALLRGRRGEMFDAVDSWLATSKEWLVLVGPSGVGKSVSAGYALQRTIRAGGRGRWQNAASLVRDLGSAFDAASRRTLGQCQHAELLVLDDLGAEHRSEFSGGLLFEVLQHRHEEQLRTVVTSNLTLQQFREHVGARLYDRIRGAGVVVEGSGKSLRGSP